MGTLQPPTERQKQILGKRWTRMASSLCLHVLFPFFFFYKNPLSPLFLHSFFYLLFWEEQNSTDFSWSRLPGLRVGNRAGHKELSSRLWPPVCSLALTMPPLTRQAPRFMYLNHYQEFLFRGIGQEPALNQRLLTAS